MKWFWLTLPLLLLANVGGFVRDGAAEIIFPAAIRFTLNLTIPASEIASATLTLTPDGRDPLVIPVDLASAVLNPDAPAADLAYLWLIPVDDPPPLFGQIDYSWSLTSNDGSIGTLSDSFVFADPRADWVRTVDPTRRFSLTAPRSLALAPASLRQVYDLLRQNTGSSRTYNLLVGDTSFDCRQRDDGTRFAQGAQSGVSVDCADGIEAAVFAGYDRLIVPAGANGETFVIATLVEAAYAPLWQGKSVPAWFAAGLDQFYDPVDKNALLLPVQQAARQRTLYAQTALESLHTDALWQAQSYALVLYIVDQIGVSGLVDLARVDASDFPAAYEQAVGQPISALFPAISQWIFTRAAESAFGITPYQPPTAVPTATRTLPPTRFPTVTLTPSLTPTITPTPTRTPRGIRTYVAPPSVTPSATLTPPPATLTPRPPGSLPTPTPIPSALQVAVAQPGVQAGLLTFLVLLLALLVFLFIRLGNRR